MPGIVHYLNKTSYCVQYCDARCVHTLIDITVCKLLPSTGTTGRVFHMKRIVT